MKRTLLQLSFILCFIIPNYAQTYLGIRSGVSLSTLTNNKNDERITNQRLIGHDVGFHCDIGLFKSNFSLLEEFHWIQRGFVNNRSEENNWIHKLNYHDINTLLKYTTTFKEIKNRKIRYRGYLVGGLSLCFGYKEKLKNKFDDEILNNDYKNRDGALVTGLGFLIAHEKFNYIFDLRYLRGLGEAHRSFRGGGSMKYSVLVFNIGIEAKLWDSIFK